MHPSKEYSLSRQCCLNQVTQHKVQLHSNHSEDSSNRIIKQFRQIQVKQQTVQLQSSHPVDNSVMFKAPRRQFSQIQGTQQTVQLESNLQLCYSVGNSARFKSPFSWVIIRGNDIKYLSFKKKFGPLKCRGTFT